MLTGAVIAACAVAAAWVTSLLRPPGRPLPQPHTGRNSLVTPSSSPSVVDPVAFTVRRTIHIAAPIDNVWSAVTRPEHISRWFGRAELDAAGVGTLTWP